jgi:hypothetical protein
MRVTDRRVARRSPDVRTQNTRIAASARWHHFGDVARVPFLCECEDDACRELITLSLTEYDRLRADSLYLVADGHAVPGGERIAAGEGFEVYKLSTGRNHR